MRGANDIGVILHRIAARFVTCARSDLVTRSTAAFQRADANAIDLAAVVSNFWLET